MIIQYYAALIMCLNYVSKFFVINSIFIGHIDLTLIEPDVPIFVARRTNLQNGLNGSLCSLCAVVIAGQVVIILVRKISSRLYLYCTTMQH